MCKISKSSIRWPISAVAINKDSVGQHFVTIQISYIIPSRQKKHIIQIEPCHIDNRSVCHFYHN